MLERKVLDQTKEKGGIFLSDIPMHTLARYIASSDCILNNITKSP